MKNNELFYFNLGLNTPVVKSDVVGIFDMDNTTIKKDSRDFLNNREKQKKIEYVGSDLPRSYVLCAGKRSRLCYKNRNSKNEQDESFENLYITSLSTQVLTKRANMKTK